MSTTSHDRQAHARAIVDGTGARIPRIQVAADQHDFVGPAALLRTADLADDVVRERFAVPAAIELQPHAHRATRHQAFVGTGYFDAVQTAITSGAFSTGAMQGSTEQAQFHVSRAS